jgi:tetratricopeptide (TPR) repeat protein
LQCRTNRIKAQYYEKAGRYSEALKLAKEALAEKISAARDPEDIAYTQVIVGELLNKLDRHDDALTILMDSNATYTRLYESKTNPNHLRVLITLAETPQKQGQSAEVPLFLEQAIEMAGELGLNADHDFNKRIDTLQQTLREQASMTTSM